MNEYQPVIRKINLKQTELFFNMNGMLNLYFANGGCKTRPSVPVEED